MMDDLISRQAAIDACLNGKSDGLPATNVACDCCAERIRMLPSAQPDVPDICVGDMISRQAAIDALKNRWKKTHNYEGNGDDIAEECELYLKQVPSAQSFHNITMSEVLAYIDGMPEDVWQEFTACLECRGWNLERRTAKWCGGEFA